MNPSTSEHHVTAPADIDPDRRAATVDLIGATRALMLSAATSELPVEDLAEATKLIAEVAERLGSVARPRALRMPLDTPGQIRAAGPGAVWQTYQTNAFGVPLSITFDGDTARATLVANATHEGPPDSVHGGISAHLMDSILGGLVQATGALAVTGTLDLRYLNRTPLDTTLDIFAEITGRSGRKIHARSWIEHQGTRCVEATGLFIRIDGVTA